ncbi:MULTISPECIES: tRNA pseudouridine(55) synthase TruB [unclassified Ruminococcus]|uniref:tRNA pseudouridine(55) synthase TruB n=1 Tax=unclassified Ruminococcus TaxID=2608920 RepID=UPI00210A4AE1|nr:tRNA pseudouridine(55) synthase TruB [Ruminococcus sp. zg-924]MCQ4115451.1 tRNA pseudouridine(55) synthase TruB [Ruminococcus sp. zg-921]
MNGVLVIDKPQDFTSFDVVAVVRGVCQTKKAGHTGTLDPMATGVLPVLLGNATKAQSLMPDSNKAYEAEFMLGLRTDTLDITGNVTEKKEANLSLADIEGVLPEFRGEIMQLPPMYSALSVDGQRLYDLARQGIEVEREKRAVVIERLEILGFDKKTQTGRISVACSKGTYIRTLIDDIGQALGTCAVMTKLRRTLACGYSIDNAIPLEELRKLKDSEGIEAVQALIKPTETVFAPYRPVYVTAAQAKRFKNGGGFDIDRTQLARQNKENGEIFRIYERGREFLGLGKVNLEKAELGFLKLFSEDTASVS